MPSPSTERRAAKIEFYRRNFRAFAYEQLKIQPIGMDIWFPPEVEPGRRRAAVASLKERGVIPFYLSDGQRLLDAKIEEQLRARGFIRGVALKGRQAGFSTYGQGRCAQRAMTTPNYSTLLIANDDDSTEKIFKKAHLMYEELDPDVRPMIRYYNKQNLCFENPDKHSRSFNPGLRSTMDFQTAKNKNAGTGTTRQALHLSEMAKYSPQYIDFLKSSLLPTIHAVPGSMVFVESTAYYGGDHFREMCDEAQSGKSIYFFHFHPWWIERHNNIPLLPGEEIKLNKEERRLQKLAEAGQPKLGVPPRTIMPEQFNWYRERGRELGDLLVQEFPSTPESAWVNLEITVFNHDILNEMAKAIRLPLRFCEIRPGPPYLLAVREGLNVADDLDYLAVWEEPIPGVQYDMGCLPDGEAVLTPQGRRPIEEIVTGDFVIGAHGKPCKVLQKMRRWHDDSIRLIRPRGALRSIALTLDHPVLVASQEGVGGNRRISRDDRRRVRNTRATWKPAGELHVGDVLVVPLPIDDADTAAEWPDGATVRVDRCIADDVVNHDDFWWMVGLWLAEGYVWTSHTPHGTEAQNIAWALGTEGDKRIIPRLVKIISKLLNRKPSVSPRGATTEVKCSSEQFAEFLVAGFGKGSAAKHLPWYVHQLPRSRRLALVRGYWDGDGCYKRSEHSLNWVSVSADLMQDMQHLLLSLGYFAAISCLRGPRRASIRGRSFNSKKTFQMDLSCTQSSRLLSEFGHELGREGGVRSSHFAWIEDGFLYVKIQRIEEQPFSGWVNNLETAGHSYALPLMTVHNCDVGAGLEDGDWSVAEVIRRDTHEQVAEYHKHVGVMDYGDDLYWLGTYYNLAHLTLEINGPGYGTHSRLQKLCYPNLYIWRHRERAVPTLSTYSGWKTSPTSKPLLVATGQDLFLHKKLIVHSSVLIKQMRNFIRTGEDSYQAYLGFDDAVMALLVGLQGADDESFGAPKPAPPLEPKRIVLPAFTDSRDFDDDDVGMRELERELRGSA